MQPYVNVGIMRQLSIRQSCSVVLETGSSTMWCHCWAVYALFHTHKGRDLFAC